MLTHADKVKNLTLSIGKSNGQTLALNYSHGHSNTTRSKAYKRGCAFIPCGQLDQILSINLETKTALVEPRVNMDTLVKATLAHGLIPLVVPEFKGITVGGAIMGGAAESSSHRYGIFHDSCIRLNLLNGRGELVQASSTENADLFFGISGSYGSFGLLVSAEIQLIPVQQTVYLSYHHFNDAHLAIEKLYDFKSDFVDGIIFSKEHTVIIEGNFAKEHVDKAYYGWYAQRVKEKRGEMSMPIYDYLFRYDQGAFWMGNFLFSPSFLARYLGQGVLNVWPSTGYFTENEIHTFKDISFPNSFAKLLTRPFMNSQKLWKLLHKAEKWVQDRLIIQDFCIPAPRASDFFSIILKDPSTFPIWLCPLKGTSTAQFLAPHHGHPFFINFGIYGLPAYSAPMQHIIHKLEHKTHEYGGRKVLYSRSYYDRETFWQIYSKSQYENLRKKMHANGTWCELTEKVLSE